MTDPTYRTLGKPNLEEQARRDREYTAAQTGESVKLINQVLVLMAERDSARRERDAMALRVMTLEAERDNAVFAPRNRLSRNPLESATVSCAGLDITVACDDHGTKDAIMDILCGCDTPRCAHCDALALRVMTLEAERDNAVAARSGM